MSVGRSLALVPKSKSAADLIADSQASLKRAIGLADDAIYALFPAASAFEADLASIALLPAARVAVRERARRLAMLVQSEMECIARVMAGEPGAKP